MSELPCPPLIRRGKGPPLLLIHGSATNHATWTAQLVVLADFFEVVTYDREVGSRLTTEHHADTAGRIALGLGDQPVLVAGSSFGAVIALDLARRQSDRIAGLILCEPPMASADELPAMPYAFGCAFEELVARAGGEAAAEMFMRATMGDHAFERIGRKLRQSLLATWPAIRSDIWSLTRYRVDYDGLRSLDIPVLLVGGGRSVAWMADTLDWLELILPDARRLTLPLAGHAMHVDDHRNFNRHLVDFAHAIGYLPSPV